MKSLDDFDNFQQTGVQDTMNELNLNLNHQEDINYFIHNLRNYLARVFYFMSKNKLYENTQSIRHFVSDVGVQANKY